MGEWQNSSNLCATAAVPKNSAIWKHVYKARGYSILLPSTYIVSCWYSHRFRYLLDSSNGFLMPYIKFVWYGFMPAICKHVITFATKVPKPAVGVFTFIIFRGTSWSHTWASLLFSFAVTATVFNPDSFARRATRY